MASRRRRQGLGAGLVVGGGLNSTIERTRIAPARKCRSLSRVRIAVRCFISGAGNGRRYLREHSAYDAKCVDGSTTDSVLAS